MLIQIEIDPGKGRREEFDPPQVGTLPDDLVIVVNGENDAAAQAAIDKVDELVSSRRSASSESR